MLKYLKFWIIYKKVNGLVFLTFTEIYTFFNCPKKFLMVTAYRYIHFLYTNEAVWIPVLNAKLRKWICPIKKNEHKI